MILLPKVVNFVISLFDMIWFVFRIFYKHAQIKLVVYYWNPRFQISIFFAPKKGKLVFWCWCCSLNSFKIAPLEGVVPVQIFHLHEISNHANFLYLDISLQKIDANKVSDIRIKVLALKYKIFSWAKYLLLACHPMVKYSYFTFYTFSLSVVNASRSRFHMVTEISAALCTLMKHNDLTVFD